MFKKVLLVSSVITFAFAILSISVLQSTSITYSFTAKVLEPVGSEIAGVSEVPLAKGAVQTQVIEKEKLIEKEILVPMADPEEWKKAIERGKKDD